MDIRDFLIPDKFKIAIVVALFLVQICAFSTLVIGPNEQNPPFWVHQALALPGLFVGYYTVGFLAMPVNVLYWYLISCVITLAVRKMRKLKTRKKPAQLAE